MNAHLTWLYGYSAPDGRPPSGPGLDPAHALRTVACGALTAVVSDVPAADWTGPSAERRLLDVEQIAPLAVRHLEIVQSIGAAVVPSAFATVFSSDEALVLRTAELGPALLDALERLRGRQEWSVKGWLEPTDTEPEKPSTSGAGWLRARRDRQRRVEGRQAALDAAADALAERLQPLAVAAVQRDGAVPEPGVELVWNWAFLVDEVRAAAFVEALETSETPPGLRLTWSGPLPPYSFVNRDDDGA